MYRDTKRLFPGVKLLSIGETRITPNCPQVVLSLRPIEPCVKHPLCKLGIGPAEVVPIVVRGIIQTETFVHDSSAGRGV